ncbi:MAG: hypothetical protein ACE37F_06310 [Nannocystaceae bacterium]|nr:hypothetical protein [bacterium]
MSRYADWIDEVLDADAESSGSAGSADVMSGPDDDASQDGCGCRRSNPSTLALVLGLLLCAPRRRALRP